MGKVAASEMRNTKKKKKGRPSLLDLQKRNLKQQQQQDQHHHNHQQTLISSTPNSNPPNRRSTRRDPNLAGVSPASSDDDNDDDDDDERKEKKVKLVVRLPPSNHHYSQPRSLNSADSNADCESHEASLKKPKIAGDRSGGDLPLPPPPPPPPSADQVEKGQKATDTLNGSPLDSGPTTPLPDKKLLVFILDRLQKKDTYGVFSEPVDPNELPDYHEIIEQPMDFRTVRKKLEERRYSNLDEFQADVFLICSNAMLYNAPDTVYFRQARSIQELAKRDFENLRQVNDDGEPQPKIVRRGRPPNKNLKKSFGGPPFERVGPESSSDATLATGGDNVIGPNSFNLRRGPSPFRFRSNDALLRTSLQSRNNETYVDLSSEWNSEFPASILKAEAKYGKKQFSLDENRRATYKQFHPSGNETFVLTTLNGDMKPLMGVGLHSEHGYARSLARFAANLAPAVWKIASKKIESVLPNGVKFGPGWVGENDALPQPPSTLPEQRSSNNPAHDGHSLGPITMPVNSVVTHRSSLPRKEEMAEAVSGQNSNSPGTSFHTQQKHMLNPGRNGFNGVSGYDLSSQMGLVRTMPTIRSGLEEASVPSQMLGVVSRSNTLSSLTPTMVANQTISEPKLPENPESTPEVAVLSGVQPWQHRQYSLPVPPDLNVRFQGPGSPSSSSFRIGSPQHPDLALQL
ncbi:Bromodomain and PHD finger-containing protein 3 [Camellia lanceoleosa]|uniref:Bromodomain and PHD finger-containing protein 3 n=1 Tax=Camellia lanceoleosa TaxID=1840588 RepID=A0ACC0GN19_9ERIC|nr:Bromodomain and PHD finger-containing protein 3 [Camellia lanceoleosa]